MEAKTLFCLRTKQNMLPHALGSPVLNTVSILSIEEERETAEVSGLRITQ